MSILLDNHRRSQLPPHLDVSKCVPPYSNYFALQFNAVDDAWDEIFLPTGEITCSYQPGEIDRFGREVPDPISMFETMDEPRPLTLQEQLSLLELSTESRARALESLFHDDPDDFGDDTDFEDPEIATPYEERSFSLLQRFKAHKEGRRSEQTPPTVSDEADDEAQAEERP